MKTTTEPLTPAQLDGRACVICGESSRPMLPLGIATRSSRDLFRCDRIGCAADAAQVRDRIPVWGRVGANPVVFAFNYNHNHGRDEDCLFVAKLREGGLVDDQIAVVLTAMEETCRHCRNAEAGCHCENDE